MLWATESATVSDVCICDVGFKQNLSKFNQTQQYMYGLEPWTLI